MIAAQAAVQRPPDAKLLVVDSHRNLIHVPRSAFVEFLCPQRCRHRKRRRNIARESQWCSSTNWKVDRSATCGQTIVGSDGRQALQRCCFR